MKPKLKYRDNVWCCTVRSEDGLRISRSCIELKPGYTMSIKQAMYNFALFAGSGNAI